MEIKKDSNNQSSNKFDRYDYVEINSNGIIARVMKGDLSTNGDFVYCYENKDGVKKYFQEGESLENILNNSVKLIMERQNASKIVDGNAEYEIFDKKFNLIDKISANEFGYDELISTNIKLHKNYYEVSFDYENLGTSPLHQQTIYFDHKGCIVADDKKNQVVVDTSDKNNWGSVSENILLISNLRSITNKKSLDNRNSYIALYDIEKGEIIFNSNEVFTKVKKIKNYAKEDFLVIHSEKSFITYNYKKTCLAEINLATGKVTLHKKAISQLTKSDENILTY